MEKKQYKKLTFEFPSEEYVYLKMACAKQGISMKDFITQAIIMAIEQYEDKLDLESLKKEKEGKENFISWEEMEKNLGWDKD